ncbi:unnamed protein product [Nyctereutes procyonoides]|uniref:(raccoon dog) hypothetical protein n=1 Tax=Nyctereutes procyonoides TaxID=34880 RepID=A0A811ZMY2_NYCPR|nr:unnamed protein product [Nyctereutes procyonoides]
MPRATKEQQTKSLGRPGPLQEEQLLPSWFKVENLISILSRCPEPGSLRVLLQPMPSPTSFPWWPVEADQGRRQPRGRIRVSCHHSGPGCRFGGTSMGRPPGQQSLTQMSLLLTQHHPHPLQFQEEKGEATRLLACKSLLQTSDLGLSSHLQSGEKNAHCTRSVAASDDIFTPQRKGLSLKLSSNYLGSKERTIDSAGWMEPQRFICGKLQSLNSAHSRNNSLYPLLSVGRDVEQHF